MDCRLAEASGRWLGAVLVSGLACQPATSGMASGDSAAVSGADSTTDAGPCETWCGGEYPANLGCDEEDDGVNAQDTGGGGGDDEEATSGGDDTDAGMGDDIPLGTDVFTIQQGGIAVGERIELTEVIVTAPPVPQPDGSGLMFTVAEPGGGPFSGITVRAAATDANAVLQPGDQVSIVGRHRTRYVFSLVQAEFLGIEVTGAGAEPPPVMIPADELADLSIGGPDAKPLESVVVRVLDPVVVDPDPCDGEIEIQALVRIDDRFLVANGEALPAPTEAGFSAVVGPLLYTFNGFEIAPRTLVDIEP